MIKDDIDLAIDAFHYIKDNQLEDYWLYLYKQLRHQDYTYDFDTPILTKDFLYNENYKNKNKKTLAKNITDQFYEGFGM